MFIYPWSNLHELNLDWFLQKFKNIFDKWGNVTTSVSTLESSATPTVKLTETDETVNLDFGLPTGRAGTIDVGTVTTTAAGTSATVTNVGTDTDAILNFGIPRGAKGDTGTAATVTVGTVTTLDPGESATVTNSGTSAAAVLNFGIPRGDTGSRGAKGDTGTAATVTVGTVTTLDPGESATVTNSGTSAAAVLNFGIPRGSPAVAPAISTAGFHNSIYRGNYLGDSLTDEQAAQISAGTFNDLWIGDYWTISGVNYRIAGFDYWLNSGDTACTTHHIVVVPDTNLYSAAMNSTNTTSGGYVGSAMYTTSLATAKTTIASAFGSSHILTHRELLTNAITSGYPSGGSWYDSTVELLNENMVYSSHIYTPGNSLGATIPSLSTIDKGQLPLFHLEPSRICNGETWWLRDVVSSAYFAAVSYGGDANYAGASISIGVRPACGIC